MWQALAHQMMGHFQTIEDALFIIILSTCLCIESKLQKYDFFLK